MTMTLPIFGYSIATPIFGTLKLFTSGVIDIDIAIPDSFGIAIGIFTIILINIIARGWFHEALAPY